MKEMLQKDVFQFQKAIFFALFELKMTHYATGLQQFFIKRAGEFTFELTSICFEERIEDEESTEQFELCKHPTIIIMQSQKKDMLTSALHDFFNFFFP